jgi:LysR family glycine cleavage system transcriptional activator
MGDKKLAHLNALRAFEAAARHMSFAKAAAEMSVTPGAISQQIKLLETYYGVRLFRRAGRSISVTDDAAKIIPQLTAAFDLLAGATASLQAGKSGGVVKVTAPPTFAVKWLAHRLGEFALQHPGIQIRLESTERLVDLKREEADLGIRYGRGSWRGMTAEHLLDEEIAPVCAPTYLSARPIKSLEDLSKANLIHDGTMDDTGLDFPDWGSWFRTFGIEIEKRPAVHFSSSLPAIQAAIDGFGVILGRSTLVDAELGDGRLVKPVPETMDTGFGYYLVVPEEAPISVAAMTFLNWLRNEAASFHRTS